ncbi:MAG: hypothetical protein ACREOC_18165 [Gemmatimonadales bacterium]
MNPIIPERPAEQQPAPPSPGFVIQPEVVQERTAEAQREAEHIEIAAKVWALITFQDLTRAQAAIDWSRDVGARVMAFVRTHQTMVEWFFIVALLGWLYLWLV